MKAANKLYLAFSFAVLVLNPPLQAQFYADWIVTTGDFHTANHWSPAMVPAADVIVVINNDGTATIANDAGPETDSTLILQDEAQMTVNAANGLGISGPRDASGNPGGKAILIVRDSARGERVRGEGNTAC